jgi:hypothetical protein
MNLTYSERRWKMRVVTDFMGSYEPSDLLYSYKDKQMVPGICTDKYCDCISYVPRDEVEGWCPCCEAETIQSILIFACVN